METTIYIWLVVWLPFFMFPEILGISSSQLTNSYFSEGWPNHQPDIYGGFHKWGCPQKWSNLVGCSIINHPCFIYIYIHTSYITVVHIGIQFFSVSAQLRLHRLLGLGDHGEIAVSETETFRGAAALLENKRVTSSIYLCTYIYILYIIYIYIYSSIYNTYIYIYNIIYIILVV